MKIFVQNIRIKYFSPGPPEFTEELRMRQETDGVLLESFLIYEPEHQVPAGEAIKMEKMNGNFHSVPDDPPHPVEWK